MKKDVGDLEACAVYLDDVVAHSDTWGPSFVARRRVAQGGAAGAVQVLSGAARRTVSLAVW